MTLLLLGVLAAVADSAPVAVVVDSKRPGAEQHADEVVSLIYLALIDAGVPRPLVLLEAQADAYTRDLAFSKARQCEGRAQCLRSLAHQLGPGGVVVGVDIGRVANALAAHVQAVNEAGEKLAEIDLSANSEQWRAAVASAVPAFARELASKRLAGSQAVTLVPATVTVPTAVASPAPLEVRSRPLPSALKWSAAAGAGVSFIASVALLVSGLSDKAAYDRSLFEVDGMKGTTLTAAEAQRLGSQVNLQLSLAVGTAVLGALFTAAATWLFVKG